MNRIHWRGLSIVATHLHGDWRDLRILDRQEALPGGSCRAEKAIEGTMETSRAIQRCLLAMVGLLSFVGAGAADAPTPGFNNKIPEKIMTPDTVETRIGAL